MRQKRWATTMVVVAGMGAFVAPAVGEDLSVFVTAGPARADAPAAKEGEVGLDILAKQRKDLEDSLKRQYGKKPEQWPADKKAEFDALAARVRRLAFEHNFRNYAGASLKEVEESVAGIRGNLADKKGVRLAATANEADLRVEVLGRFVGPDEFGSKAAKIGLRVSPAGRLDPALLTKNPIAWPEHSARMAGAWSIPWHQYSPDEPYWLVQVERPAGAFGGMMYGKVEAHAAGNIEKLAKESGAVIGALRRASSH